MNFHIFAFLVGLIFVGQLPTSASASEFTFKLTKGKGIPVCEAYLKRLTNTNFVKPPFCGRPEDDSVTGFGRLNRVSLTAAEVYKLNEKVNGFQLHQNQNFWRNQLRDKPGQEYQTFESVESDVASNRRGAWRYDPPVDIDNDGQPEHNLIIWKTSGRPGGCGSLSGYDTYPAHASYTANILDEKNEFIDEKRTRELFGHPVGGFPNTRNGKIVGLFPRFRYVGESMGIFTYQGEYYFDTFFDGWGDFEGKRRGDFRGRQNPKLMDRMINTLGVFQRKGSKTSQICEYYWADWKKLEAKKPDRNRRSAK